MALLAEELVEEWLNRNGYFTIRGIKLGVHEIDLLAMRVNGSSIEARHVEIQASVHPISYFSPLPKEVRKNTGRGSASVKTRSEIELRDGIKEWINKKYYLEAKEQVRRKLFPGQWSFELVVHQVKFPQELDLLREQGILIHNLDEIVASLSDGHNTIIPSASGSDLFELVMLGRE
jgi:hypothetical protein